MRHIRTLSTSCPLHLHGDKTDPRFSSLGQLIEDKFAHIQEDYQRPKNAIVLAHGLLGFAELKLAGSFLPPIEYWHGIKNAMTMKGIKVITTTVPPYASIENRARVLVEDIAAEAKGCDVNIIAHSMGGLDSRYMISKLRPTDFKVRSLTTVATPHRGSVIADHFMQRVDAHVARLRKLSKSIDRITSEAQAFSQLTRKYLKDEFNPNVPDIEDVRYFSYGAMFQPGPFNIFRPFHRVLEEAEGPNDGLVSVASSKWGGDAGYKGTLVGVSHLDLINWSNRIQWMVEELTGNKRKFNAIAFYLDIADNNEKAFATTIKLDKPHSHFTNLDHITGRVVLQLHSDTAISAIHVKLEGESRTRLSTPRNDREKKKAEIEVHKILYRVQVVFPSPDIAQHSSPNAAFTLAAGVYEYPFEFKFPFNNSCSNQNSMMTNLSMVGLRVEVARDTYAHVKKTLPPSLNTFPGEAEIKYYVKTTVVRPQFYKENIRSIAGFNFLPIEPPRNGNPNEETYARRQHEFMRQQPQAAVKKGGLFRKQSSTPLIPLSTADPVRVSVDARLPNPPILTCNEPIPLRIIVTKKSHTPEPMFLQLLQIELISYTNIRAHELVRTEPLSTLILSRSNMNVLIGQASDPMGQEWKIDASLWNRLPLPPNVAPSFETCNISRYYELEVRVGLSHGPAGRSMPQVIVVPLRLGVRVYSGIRPPPALIEAMTANRKLQDSQLGRKPSIYDENNPPPQPPRPVNQVAELASHNNLEGDDAPPSYEDAMADMISPIDGPRGEYHQTPAPAFQGSRNFSGPVGDTKTPFPDPQTSHNEDDHNYHHEGDEDGDDFTRSFSRDSSESVDMLPQSPRLRPVSYADSIFEDRKSGQTQGHTSNHNDTSANETQQEPPPAFMPSQTPQPRRAISTGVPNRRPVPNSSQQKGNAS
ncbi:Immunoglobulin E-set [Penicillium occitanis (nom. inval.)]|nr:hypothetical protein PENOC_082140 [Penicillium occitanis (nom. inval.)]PCH04275.1 Immunoglobulin E-set [Penicillium occitanis (nom. inval.)]